MPGGDSGETQCIFDLKRFRFEESREMVSDAGHERRCPEVHTAGAGMSVPDELVKRMKRAGDKKAEGVKITVEHIEDLKTIPGVASVHVLVIAWESIAAEIVEKVGLLSRPDVVAEEPAEAEVAVA